MTAAVNREDLRCMQDTILTMFAGTVWSEREMVEFESVRDPAPNRVQCSPAVDACVPGFARISGVDVCG